MSSSLPQTQLAKNFESRRVVTDHCHDSCVSVVDGPEGDTLMETILHKEAVKAILNGATIFFPDKLDRRDKLFHMMVS